MSSRLAKKEKIIETYWKEVFIPGKPYFDTAMAASMIVLYVGYFIALIWMVPWAVLRTFWARDVE